MRSLLCVVNESMFVARCLISVWSGLSVVVCCALCCFLGVAVVGVVFVGCCACLFLFAVCCLLLWLAICCLEFVGC